MEEEAIISELCKTDPKFKKCFEDHVKLEQDLEALYSLKFYPPEVEANIKTLKLKKLKGKDEMDRRILSYRKEHKC